MGENFPKYLARTFDIGTGMWPIRAERGRRSKMAKRDGHLRTGAVRE
jgi:hypothetical protein